MQQTKPATHPVVSTADQNISGQSLIEAIIAARGAVLDGFDESMRVHDITASEPIHLCIVATETELRVAAVSSMLPDDEMSHATKDYFFWFALPPDVVTRDLKALPPAALALLLLIQSWVGTVNTEIRQSGPPYSTEVVSLTKDILRAAVDFMRIVLARPEGARLL